MKSLFCVLILCLAFLHPRLLLAHDSPKKQPLLSDVSRLGTVNLTSSCQLKAQESLNQGAALLHHMMYRQAELHFRDALANAPECAMLHWGLAMSQFNPLWPTRPSEEEIQRATHQLNKAQLIDNVSSRERAYLNAVKLFFKNAQTLTHQQRLVLWHDAQQKLANQYPDDPDAIALYALAMLATAPKGDRDFKVQSAAAVLLEKLYAQYPTHPGVIHYSIHAYDNPLLAKRGQQIARAYDKIAPDVPHALHMPTHIFVRTGSWQDVASWNIRSAKAALKYPAGNGVSMHYPHAVDYLVYAYMQMGDEANARRIIDEMNQYQHIQPVFPAGFGIASARARYLLEGRHWQQAGELALNQPIGFPWKKFPHVEAIIHFARGVGAARSGNMAGAKASLTALTQLQEETVTLGRAYWAVIVNAQRLTVAAWLAYAENNTTRAMKLMQQAATIEDSVDKNPVTPGAVLPARELLADMAMLAQRYDEAIAAYQAVLVLSPNRLNSLKGLAAAYTAQGDEAKAAYFRQRIAQNLIAASAP